MAINPNEVQWDDIDPSEVQWDDAPSLSSELSRQAKLTGRAVAEGVAALPLAAMDAGVGIRNAATRSNYELPSATFTATMDALTGPRQGLWENVVGLLGSGLAAAKLPVPNAGQQAPASFRTRADLVKELTAANVRAAQAAGYVIPPVTSNPTATSRTLEGIAGKLTTAQLASAKNQSVTARLAARAIGLNEDVPLTLDAVRAVRSEAGKAYEIVRGTGNVQMDGELFRTLSLIESSSKGANRSFPGLASNDVIERVSKVKQNQFDAGDAVDAIIVLRDYADQAFSSGSKRAGMMYKEAAKALENALDRHMAAQGNSEALSAFRSARETIAKTYSIEKAMNPVTGDVSAVALAKELPKLTGELRQAGAFGKAFPKAARTFNESLPGISPLDFYAAGGAAAVTENPNFLVIPFLRQATRSALFTPLGQRLAVPKVGGPLRPEVVNALAYGPELIREQ